MKQGKLSESLPIGSKERAKLKQSVEGRTAHGGEESVGKRKTIRPYSSKAPVHLILKSKRANGKWSLRHRKNQAKITAMIYVYATRFKVRVYRAANTGHEIQLLVKATERKALADYLRVLAGRIAVTVSGARKGVKRIGKFWDHLCWSRLVKWGHEFHFVQKMVQSGNFLTRDEDKKRAPTLRMDTLVFRSD